MTIINDPISTNSISEEEKEILSCFKNSNIHPSPIEITAILKKEVFHIVNMKLCRDY